LPYFSAISFARLSIEVVHVAERAELYDVNSFALEPGVEGFLL
jgi:hypothetical protein